MLTLITCGSTRLSASFLALRTHGNHIKLSIFRVMDIGNRFGKSLPLRRKNYQPKHPPPLPLVTRSIASIGDRHFALNPVSDHWSAISSNLHFFFTVEIRFLRLPAAQRFQCQVNPKFGHKISGKRRSNGEKAVWAKRERKWRSRHIRGAEESNSFG